MGIWDDFFTKAKTLFANEEQKKTKCYYEMLGVSKDATEDDIKRAYKKMALKWHPDKNPDRLQECTAYFVILQQAYEVLSNPHERAFYDRHRENIIHGGGSTGPNEKKDTGINLASYFEKSCFYGFGDDAKGFYAVYRELFHNISAEEYLYVEEMEDRNFPVFGNSKSTYEMIVEPFYSFWMDFSTCRSFAWLDQYDLRQAEDRATLRTMEKENKRLRDAGKRQRSEEIQRLVIHIRKLDRRVKLYREQLEERNKKRQQEVEMHRLQAIRKNLEDLDDYEEDEEAKREHMRRLEEIENQLDAEFGQLAAKPPMKLNEDNDNNEDSCNDAMDEDDENSYCVVCEKYFKSSKAYSNHVRSKKHRQGVELLRKHMRDEDKVILEELEREQQRLEQPPLTNTTKRQKGKKKENAVDVEQNAKTSVEMVNDEAASAQLEATFSQSIVLNEEEDIKPLEENEPFKDSKEREKTKKARRANVQKNNKKTEAPKATGPTEPVISLCDICGEEFESRTKLFTHLRDSGHATLKNTDETIKAKTAAKKKGGKKK